MLEDESVAPAEMIQIGGEPHPVARLIITMLTMDTQAELESVLSPSM